MIELGAHVRDKITGFEGVVVAKTEYLTGCNRISLQSKELKDGKPLDWQNFDEDQCEIIDLQKVKLDMKTPGGPQQFDPQNDRR
jgi:hypothetical protein